MTERDVFPRTPDREIIRAFLTDARHKVLRDDAAYLRIANGQLTIAADATIAWYDTAGALCAKLPAVAFRAYAVLAINRIMIELGHPPDAITREPGSPPRYFFQGAPVAIDAPFVLSGPLGIQAYRAQSTTIGQAP